MFEMRAGRSKEVDEEEDEEGVEGREQGLSDARRGGGMVSQRAAALLAGSEGADMGERRQAREGRGLRGRR